MLRLGLEDPRGRLWVDTLSYVRTSKPKVCIFENVEGLLHANAKNAFDGIVRHLEKSGYIVEYQVLSTQVHGGLPQTRKRVYILAWLKAHVVSESFTWPCELTKTIRLQQIVGKPSRGSDRLPVCPSSKTGKANVVKALKELKSACPDIDLSEDSKHIVVIDVGCSERYATWHIDEFPTITAGRAKGCGWWLLPHRRNVSMEEMYLLQGFDPARIMDAAERAGVKKTALGMMVGNSMTLSILERILPPALARVGILPNKAVKDRWAALR